MNTVERIKEICKERNIHISTLEKGLGFANGYLGQLKKGTLPADRLNKIAEYLSVSPEYLMTGEQGDNYYLNEKTREIAKTIYDNPELHLLFDAAKDASTEDLMTVYEVLMALKRKSPVNNS